MLVLSRQVNESILLGDDIVITVLEIEGSRVKIGIQAPRDLLVLREELAKGGKKHNRKSSESGNGNGETEES